jgi:hypothetical protein
MAEEFVDRDTFLNRKTWWALRNTVLGNNRSLQHIQELGDAEAGLQLKH